MGTIDHNVTESNAFRVLHIDPHGVPHVTGIDGAHEDMLRTCGELKTAGHLIDSISIR